MRNYLQPTVAILALAGCAGMNGGSSDLAPIASESGGQCNPRPVQYHVGHKVTQEMGAQILRESGAKTLRWGPPDSVWTMDYREDRVNVRYDDNMTITYVTCG